MARRQFLGIPVEAGLAEGFSSSHPVEATGTEPCDSPEATSEKTATTGLSEGAAPDAVNEKAARTGDASEKIGKDNRTDGGSARPERAGSAPAMGPEPGDSPVLTTGTEPGDSPVVRTGIPRRRTKAAAPAALAIVRSFISSSFAFP